MEQFTLEKYLENPQRKVVNGWGEKVRILCTDLHGFGEEKIAAAVEVDKGCEIIRTYDNKDDAETDMKIYKGFALTEITWEE